MAKTPKDQNPKKQVPVIRYNYNVEKVLALRKDLREVVGVEFLHTTPTGDKFKRLVDLFAEMLPKSISYRVLEDTLRSLANVYIDDRNLDNTCWRVAGNVKRLTRQKAVPPWHIQKVQEWVPVQITACSREKTSRGSLGAKFQFRILAGTSAGLLTDKFWTLKFCRFISVSLGFSKYNPRHQEAMPYTVPEHLVGLRLYVCVDPALSDKTPVFSNIGFPCSSVRFNKVTLGCRFRLQSGFQCLMQKRPEELPCHLCPIGFTKCRAATHRQDWVTGDCSECGQTKYFDPERKVDRCVDCNVRAAYKHGT